MPRTQLTPEWSVEVDDSFASRLVEDDLQMVSQGPPIRTIWAATYSPPMKQSPQDVLAMVRKDAPHDVLETFEEQGADAREVRYAMWVHEVGADTDQWALYAHTARRGSLVQIVLISELESDLDWALQTWRSLEYAAST